MRAASRSTVGHAILAFILCFGTVIKAEPLRVKFTSCLGSSNVVNPDEQMVVESIFADLVPGRQAAQQGLIGDGHDVLRIDLIGNANSTVQGYNNATNKLATLFTDTSTAHISVFKSATWLCNSLFPSDLPSPYYPFNTTYCPLPPGPFAVNLTIPLYRSYALTTLHTQVRIVDTSSSALTMACYDMDFTPYKSDGWYYRLFLYLPIAVAIGFWTVTWAARFATGWIVGSGVAEYGVKEGHSGSGLHLPMGTKRDARMRKWGTMIISGLSGERLSVSSALLRFVTPGLRDVLYYIQYCTVLGMIAVNWPGFAYPILAKGAWADLVWNITLVQGDDAQDKRIHVRPDNYTAPTSFASMMNDPYYPLYLDAEESNSLLDLGPSAPGIESWSALVGLRPQDLLGTCLAIFLCLTLGIYLISILLWILHAAFEYTSKQTEVRRHPSRPNLLTSPHGSSGGKEAFESRSYGWDADGPQLPTQATLSASKQTNAPSKLRKTWLRFRPKGEAGAFHQAALYGNLLRLIMTFHLPITTFSVYQLTLADATIVSRVFAALAFVFISFAIPVGILVKMKRTPSGKLYEATRTLLALGPMYNVYLEHKQMFRVFPLAASLIEGIVVGAGQKSGLAQAIVFVLVELAMLIIPAIWYPWGEGASMGSPSALIGVARVACAVLVMLLSGTLDMGKSANDWIAYAVLILHAIVFVFFTLMILTKLVEGLIRLFGGAHFDESTSPLDSGLFAAIMDLDCLNGVRGGKAAQRRRRKRGSRLLQRNVSAVGSLTTQMMLDRHSEGVSRQPVSEGNRPFLSPIPLVETRHQTSYFQGHQPPLGPPPMERHSSDSRSDDPSGSGHIMDAWRPSQPLNLSPARHSMALPMDGDPRNRPLSMSTDGRTAVYDSPSSPNSSRAVSPPALSPPALHITTPSKPVHTRTNSSSAVIERYDNSTPSSPRASHNTFMYPPGREGGQRPNREGLLPPVLDIPRRPSLNNIKDQYSDNVTPPRKSKKKSKVGGWFGKPADDAESSTAEESDDEPSPSRRRIIAQFEQASSPLAEEKKGWLQAIGLGKKRSLDESRESGKDENRARKAALAAASGSVFAGVEAPQSRGFVVNRKGAITTPSVKSAPDMSSGPSSPVAERSFKVKRPGPAPSQASPTTPAKSTPRVIFTPASGGRSGKEKEASSGFKVLSRECSNPASENRSGHISRDTREAGEFGALASTGYSASSMVPMSDREAAQRYSGDFGNITGPL